MDFLHLLIIVIQLGITFEPDMAHRCMIQHFLIILTQGSKLNDNFCCIVNIKTIKINNKDFFFMNSCEVDHLHEPEKAHC